MQIRLKNWLRMFATVEATARAKSLGMVSRVRSLKGRSAFDRSASTEMCVRDGGGGNARRDRETDDFRQNGRETFRNYCSFKGAITESKVEETSARKYLEKDVYRGNSWLFTFYRLLRTSDTPGALRARSIVKSSTADDILPPPLLSTRTSAEINFIRRAHNIYIYSLRTTVKKNFFVKWKFACSFVRSVYKFLLRVTWSTALIIIKRRIVAPKQRIPLALAQTHLSRFYASVRKETRKSAIYASGKIV